MRSEVLVKRVAKLKHTNTSGNDSASISISSESESESEFVRILSFEIRSKHKYSKINPSKRLGVKGLRWLHMKNIN